MGHLPTSLLLIALLGFSLLARTIPWREKWPGVMNVNERDSVLRTRMAEDAARDGARAERGSDLAP